MNPVRLIACFCVIICLTACGSKPDNIIGVDGRPSVTEVPDLKKHTIYIATTRQPSADPAVFFSSDRQLDVVNFAKVDVTIPPNHVSGQIERAGSIPPNALKEFVVVNPQKFGNSNEFKASLNRDFGSIAQGDRDVLLFVHGYNTSITDAVLRLAQIKEDSGFKGIPILFSWASADKGTKYVYDLNSALVARDGLIYAAQTIESTRVEEASILAHSMGNFLTVEAMRQAELKGAFNRRNKLKHIVLASPDIDMELFSKQMQAFPRDDRKFYVLISGDDKALRASRRIAGGVPRLGAADPEDIEALGVSVIDLTEIDDKTSLAHSKFADSPDIIKIIGTRLNEDTSLDPPQPGALLRTITGDVAAF